MFFRSTSFIRRSEEVPVKMINSVLIDLPTPMNMSYFWNFGSLLGLFLFSQMLSGLFLSMHYISLSDYSFDSVNSLTREIYSGWFIRNLHIAGSSGFFFFLFLHVGRGLYFGSFKFSKTWFSGVSILILSMAASFLGYVLPWGQMSYWGATVITNFLSVIPYVGDMIVIWMWGSFSVDYPTLTRFFALHFVLPFVMLGFVMMHMAFLHLTGSKNPLTVTSNGDKMPFFPYFATKDIFGFLLSFIMVFLLFFMSPESFVEYQNFMQANPLVTPPHIQPEWYFLAAYAVLRAVPKKLGGVVSLLFFVAVLFLFPMFSYEGFLPIKSSLIFEICWWFWVSNLIFLTWLGACPVEDPFVLLSQISGLFHFLLQFLYLYFL